MLWERDYQIVGLMAAVKATRDSKNDDAEDDANCPDLEEDPL